MTVSLIRVCSLTWATVRPARWCASAKAAPMDTLRLHSSATPRTPCGQEAGRSGPIISGDLRGGSAGLVGEVGDAFELSFHAGPRQRAALLPLPLRSRPGLPHAG